MRLSANQAKALELLLSNPNHYVLQRPAAPFSSRSIKPELMGTFLIILENDTETELMKLHGNGVKPLIGNGILELVIPGRPDRGDLYRVSAGGRSMAEMMIREARPEKGTNPRITAKSLDVLAKKYGVRVVKEETRKMFKIEHLNETQANCPYIDNPYDEVKTVRLTSISLNEWEHRLCRAVLNDFNHNYGVCLVFDRELDTYKLECADGRQLPNSGITDLNGDRVASLEMLSIDEWKDKIVGVIVNNVALLKYGVSVVRDTKSDNFIVSRSDGMRLSEPSIDKSGEARTTSYTSLTIPEWEDRIIRVIRESEVFND